MSDINKIRVDSTTYDVKDLKSVHYGEQSKGYVGKNLIDIYYPIAQLSSNVVADKSDNNIHITSLSDGGWRNYAFFIKNLYKNTDMIFTTDCDLISGKTLVVISGTEKLDGTDRTIIKQTNAYSSDHSYDTSFNTGTSTYLLFQLFVTAADSSSGEANYSNTMLRFASISDNTYEPYMHPNTEIGDKITYSDNVVLGAKNLVRWINGSTHSSQNGITYTKNSDFSLTIKGTATANSWYIPGKFKIDAPIGTKFKVTGCPSGGNVVSTYKLYITDEDDSAKVLCTDIGSGAFFENNGHTIGVAIQTFNGYAYPEDGLVFKPMISMKYDNSDDYVPPVMTNRELTTDTQGLRVQSKGYVGKNALVNTATNAIVNGVSYTINNDKSISAVNIATSTSEIVVYYGENNLLDGQEYVISNGVPKDSGYFLVINGHAADGTWKKVLAWTTTDGNDHFVNDVSEYPIIRVLLHVNNGVNPNKTFYPMIRLASIPDSTYEPYLTTNTEIDNKVSWKDNAILGAKNFVYAKEIRQTVVTNGVTFTRNSDGSITVNGTASAQTFYNYPDVLSDLEEGKQYIMSGCPTGGDWSKYVLYSKHGTDYGDGVLITRNSSTSGYEGIQIVIAQNYVADNLVFKPMIRLASDTDDTYVPYAMTNRELTKIAVDNNVIDLPAGASVTLLEKTKLILTVIPSNGNASIIACQMGTENPWVIAGTTPISSDIVVDNSVNSNVTITNNLTYAISVFVQGRYEVQ